MFYIQYKDYIYLIAVIGIIVVGTSCSSFKRSSKQNRYTSTTKKRNSADTSKTYKPSTRRKTGKISGLSFKRFQIVQSAERYVGIPYLYGGKSTKGFDCSGFTAQVYFENGVSVKGASHHQAVLGKKINKTEAKPGDLVSFKSMGKITHVAIITKVAENEIWVAHSTSSKGVIYNEIWNSKYWRSKIYEFRDVIN